MYVPDHNYVDLLFRVGQRYTKTDLIIRVQFEVSLEKTSEPVEPC